MRDIEQWLRESMIAAVADEKPPNAVMDLVRRRHRRHVARLAASGAAAAVVLVAAVPLARAWHPDAGPVRPANGGSPAGPPTPAHGHYSTFSIPGGTNAEGYAISDAGAIAGCFTTAKGGRGFIDKHGKISVIADPAAGPRGRTCVLDDNDAGTIVGNYGSTSDIHGFVDRNGKFTAIDDPEAGKGKGKYELGGTIAASVDRAGVIVGWYYNKRDIEEGFVLRNGKFSDVDYPLSAHAHPSSSSLNGIADNGTIVGTYNNLKTGSAISFLDQSGKFTSIAVPRAYSTQAFCLSETGDVVVGVYQPTRNGIFIGFIYRAGVYHTLRYPAAPNRTYPGCSNAAGKVAGSYNDRQGNLHAFLFTPAK
jgi:uncharacterized membrane protein